LAYVCLYVCYVAGEPAKGGVILNGDLHLLLDIGWQIEILEELSFAELFDLLFQAQDLLNSDTVAPLTDISHVVGVPKRIPSHALISQALENPTHILDLLGGHPREVGYFQNGIKHTLAAPCIFDLLHHLKNISILHGIRPSR
jgi:hypothetical protein